MPRADGGRDQPETRKDSKRDGLSSIPGFRAGPRSVGRTPFALGFAFEAGKGAVVRHGRRPGRRHPLAAMALARALTPRPAHELPQLLPHLGPRLSPGRPPRPPRILGGVWGFSSLGRVVSRPDRRGRGGLPDPPQSVGTDGTAPAGRETSAGKAAR